MSFRSNKCEPQLNQPTKHSTLLGQCPSVSPELPTVPPSSGMDTNGRRYPVSQCPSREAKPRMYHCFFVFFRCGHKQTKKSKLNISSVPPSNFPVFILQFGHSVHKPVLILSAITVLTKRTEICYSLFRDIRICNLSCHPAFNCFLHPPDEPNGLVRSGSALLFSSCLSLLLLFSDTLVFSFSLVPRTRMRILDRQMHICRHC